MDESGNTGTAGAARRPSAAPVTVAALVYPGCTLLDLAGPQAVLAALPGAEVRAYWKEAGPVVTDTETAIVAHGALADAPAAPTVLLVPGGAAGAVALLDDAEVLGWLGRVGRRARWVTSVCSGSLLLGAAGLLAGRRATSHWAVRDALAAFGAIPTRGRVVADGNVLTGGGVTAGIDFGLALAARLAGEEMARAVQLAMEYAPEPPFDAGTPEAAGPATVAAVLAEYDMPGAQRAIGRAAARLARAAAAAAAAPA